MKFLWKIYLLWHGYCPKHVIEKNLALGYDIGDMNYYCPECERESNAKTANRLARAKAVIESKP